MLKAKWSKVKYWKCPVPQAVGWNKELTNLKVKILLFPVKGLAQAKSFHLGLGKETGQNGETHFLLCQLYAK